MLLTTAVLSLTHQFHLPIDFTYPSISLAHQFHLPDNLSRPSISLTHTRWNVDITIVHLLQHLCLSYQLTFCSDTEAFIVDKVPRTDYDGQQRCRY
jgi:hypothetical protein